jgi:outer membrane protein OmpA-like peptidoglycan-associated protein
MKFKIFLFLITLQFSSKLFAQDFLGFSNSNYAGVTGISLQPASIVDDRMKFDMTLFGFNAAFYNNYLGIKKSALTPRKEVDKNGYVIWFPTLARDTDIVHNSMEEKVNNKYKSVYTGLRINMPSFMIYCNHKNSVAFTWDIRNQLNVDGISPDLAKLIIEGLDFPKLWESNAPKLNSKNVSIQQMTWAEYGITYGRVLKEDNEHAFKVAGRLKFLQGILSSYMNIKDFNFNVPNDTLMTFLRSEVSYGHSRNFEFEGNNIKLKTLESYPGIGADLGVVYEWRPNFKSYKYDMDNETDLWRRDKNKYKVRVGFSILDIGRIKFQKGTLSNNFIADFNRFNLKAFDTIQTVMEFDSILRRSFPIVNPTTTYKMTLPTAFSFQFDYNIWKDVYVNVTPFLTLKYKNRETKIHEYNAISITPRWDHKWFGVFLPMQYHQLDGFRFGATVRLGPIIIGTTNLTPFISNKSMFGGDIHALLKIPVPFNAPKDRDKDKISDRKDKCKDVPGVWEFMGCPDRDGDHIVDSEDKCPEIAGLKKFLGCPDKDNDNIADGEDDCPDDSGLVAFKGCPDTDGDGIINKFDDCPLDFGLAIYNGCPDKDNDSIPDIQDACPDVAGPKKLNGCPDKDGDGLLDFEDNCPEVAGTKENKGCPWDDADKDGLFDKDDQCPTLAGPIENKGCPWPDTDKDGVLDKDDSCPDIAGTVELKGCLPEPELKEEEKKVLEKAFSNLEFASGKDIIKKTSLPYLDELAELLKAHVNDWVLVMSGHTDNQGDDAKNMILSEKRVKAVKKYLVSKGEKEDRIEISWFGSTRPIADNNTEEGRQKNRRVEMKIVFTH